MTSVRPADARSVALDDYLARRAGQGFRVETRSGIQAVIVRRHRLHFMLRWFAAARAEQRLDLRRQTRHGHLARRRAHSVVTGRT